MNPCDMETVSGKIINLEKPDPSKISIDDISWSLSRIARYTGHTIQAIPYSVGQHSIHVSIKAQQLAGLYGPIKGLTKKDILRIAIHAQIHDAGEAYTGDINGPLKKHPKLRPVIKQIEREIDEAIILGLGIPGFENDEQEDLAHQIIKEADNYCQAIEAYNFMCSRGLHWGIGGEISLVEYQEFEMPKTNVVVYQEFLDRYEYLMSEWKEWSE